MEEQVASLDGSVEHLAKRGENTVGEKALLEDQVKQKVVQLAAKESMRKIVENDMAWLLRHVIVRVIDRVIESTEFSMRIWCMKAICVVAGVEGVK